MAAKFSTRPWLPGCSQTHGSSLQCVTGYRDRLCSSALSCARPHIPYLEKGWCWAEINIAALGGTLEMLSAFMAAKLAHDQAQWGDELIDWQCAMLGKPPLPIALAENKAAFEELMEYWSNI